MRQVLGSGYVVQHVTRMHGGAQKVVYKIECAGGFVCVLYVWDLSNNYFQEEIENDDPNERSYGGDLFERNNRHLASQGIRTPALYDMYRERTARYPYDYALVEYVGGPKAEAYLRHPDVWTRDRVFGALGEMLSRMHADERAVYCKLDRLGLGEHAEACHLRRLDSVKPQLVYAAAHLDRIGVYHHQLLDRLHALASRIAPRSRYGFIHGELGPDHVLVNESLEPYLIDIEGAAFFDIEHEHSFLEFRFGEDYRYLRHDSLDPDRMAFYRFCHHLSLTAGGLKLLHRGFPDQIFARGLADHHARRALRYIGAEAE
ncbi:phosphotransferase [Cohnella nanjingensis]|uniref:Phosphotransferase n=1 Tax=Cohnella nanjingensis TaxID=1387779 RepID=A0A7X0RRS9_9BACL|nr:phosphotransferase [Cohnella nanjingensis]MBB6671235.1 phosphotransferase [Cohnella nanjingensis]